MVRWSGFIPDLRWGFIWLRLGSGEALMADGVSGIGSAPFNVQSDIHQQTQARERIEAHLVEQRVTKEHRANHTHLEALREQKLDLGKAYDRFGTKTTADRPQGTNINIEV